jgi:flagellar motor switch protein FliM
MSGQVLSPDAIAALVEAAKEGKLPVEEAAASARRRGRVRTVDFSRPSKFTTEHERRFRRAMEAYCRAASTRLSAEIRMAIELEVINVAQLTWANAHGSVPGGSIDCIVEVAPLNTRLLFSAETSLILATIDLLLGGNGDEPGVERRLTEIDWALARHVFERFLAQLSIIWNDQADVELEVAGLDSHLETAQLALVSEPTLAITLEARSSGASSTVSLLIPYASIASVADRFSTRDESADVTAHPEIVEQVRTAVGGVELEVRAEVGATSVAVEQVLALAPGDVLRLDARAEQGVTLFAGDVPMHRGRPGRSGPRRAVQVLERVGSPR